MKIPRPRLVRILASFTAACAFSITPDVLAADAPAARHTVVSIVADQFLINGQPTYKGRVWHNHRIEGLLFNSRMVQGIYDDLNPETAPSLAYPDTGKWDPERNNREFIAAMPEWRRHGLLAFTLNLQGGSPHGYGNAEPRINSAFAPDGGLRPDYLARLERVLDAADRLGMVVILGYFYAAQDQQVTDEAAVLKAVDNATRWILDHGYTHVVIEVNNECDVNGFDHDILKPKRVAELVARVKAITHHGRRLLVGTSYTGGVVPSDPVLAASDFALVHGNGKKDPERIRTVVKSTRARPAWRLMPVVVNEDDHFDFDQPDNHFVAAIGEYASWGYFDPGKNNYRDGYQCPPINWGINTARKQAFFRLLAEITGASAPTTPAPAAGTAR